MVSRRRQQLGGFAIALVGACFTGWNWYTALTRGYYYRKAGMLFPAFFIFGVALILFPGYREQRIARGENISGVQGWKLITTRWWVVLVAALVAGVVNFVFLSSR
jgi:ABC-type Fe3+-siderophore transport system permease subunit